jgi:two-component system sensor histidine kinase UhpB
VHTSDNERISTLAREALEEMRLSVRGLTGRPVRAGRRPGRLARRGGVAPGAGRHRGEWRNP